MRQGQLVGSDEKGNNYYQATDPDTAWGRERWMVPAKPRGFDASDIPCEWHMWLHKMTDATPAERKEFKPIRFGLEHDRNHTGNLAKAYFPRGHPLAPNHTAFAFTERRAWVPPAKTES
eukprot:TRINITY_DN1653_c0_g1_i1.p1 TRINITY_DN1653_c0_g1~~TRINITY_DN1653_c0_g1_i1.p1  ORF type:complete len:119 (-),score=4.46 TRINITY_DN1653_c0_g1_i1:354-710(-)